jgi:hypothetical protein
LPPSRIFGGSGLNCAFGLSRPKLSRKSVVPEKLSSRIFIGGPGSGAGLCAVSTTYWKRSSPLRTERTTKRPSLKFTFPRVALELPAHGGEDGEVVDADGVIDAAGERRGRVADGPGDHRGDALVGDRVRRLRVVGGVLRILGEEGDAGEREAGAVDDVDAHPLRLGIGRGLGADLARGVEVEPRAPAVGGIGRGTAIFARPGRGFAPGASAPCALAGNPSFASRLMASLPPYRGQGCRRG